MQKTLLDYKLATTEMLESLNEEEIREIHQDFNPQDLKAAIILQLAFIHKIK